MKRRHEMALNNRSILTKIFLLVLAFAGLIVALGVAVHWGF